ncbi:hypothetical protein MMC24_004838 [Lignoscripta atroalba]|nr:hypothetical protein [Lignoscripta atroalba]
MAHKDADTPRVFLARHGDTEWTSSGRHTGITELELTDNGVKQVLGTGKILVGPGKLIDPAKLAHVFVSPRKRAQVTLDLLFEGAGKDGLIKEHKVTTTEELAEWDYGKYEGLLTKEIRARREGQGLDQERPWDIWRDGCEDGETARQVSDRLDRLIHKIQVLQQPYMHGEKPADVVLLSHGHLLRAFAKRWLQYPMDSALSLMMEPGGIGILSYQHHSMEEPALLLGWGFPLETKAEI